MSIDKTKKKNIDALIGKINKKFGANAIATLKDVEEQLTVKYYKTPSHEVNAMLGGGIGKGKIVELYGQPSSGKTSMALEIIAKAQQDPNFMAAWIETEASIDPEYLKYFGIDLDRLVIIQQSEELQAEACMDIIRSLVNSGEFGIICLNSVAALTPKKEVEDELEKQNIALTARLLSKFLRITTGSLATSNTSLILINQVRTNLNSMYSLATTTGGMAIPFYATQRIEMKKERVMAGDPIKEDEGVKVRCKVVKNRLAKGNPYKICNYYALYGKGIDGTSELGTVLVREEILRKSGAWIRYEDESGDILQVKTEDGDVVGKWNGNSAFVNFLRESPMAREYFEKLLDEKLATGKVGVSISEEEIAEIEKVNENIELEEDSEVAATKQ